MACCCHSRGAGEGAGRVLRRAAGLAPRFLYAMFAAGTEEEPPPPPDGAAPDAGSEPPPPKVTENTPGVKRFPCRNCGGPLLFMPGTTHLKCPYCATENDIPVDAGDNSYLEEHDFLEALAREEKSQAEAYGTVTAESVRCSNCGAVTSISEIVSAARCPYCDSPLSMQNHFASKFSVQAVLPFAIDAEKALAKYQDWLASRWFAPNDFKRRATRGEAMKGIYMPYWTYDSATTTWYTGMRGDAYYVTRPVTVQRNGRMVSEMRQERRIRWSRASGTVRVAFDDVLVPASHSLPGNLVDALEPWRLDRLQPFRQEFLSGFVTETYQLGLKDGFDEAKLRMAPIIDDAIRQDIGGDEQRIDTRQPQYDKVTFKHILLPVWLSAYAYGGGTYRFIINAQTGEVSGDRPWSAWKIGFAVAIGVALVAAALYYLQ